MIPDNNGNPPSLCTIVAIGLFGPIFGRVIGPAVDEVINSVRR